MIYLLHPAAEADLRDAATYYRERAGSALAQAFLADFELTIALLVRHPLVGTSWLHGKRRLLLRHFPYAIVHTVAAQEIRVLAVAHQSRRPGYWRNRRW